MKNFIGEEKRRENIGKRFNHGNCSIYGDYYFEFGMCRVGFGNFRKKGITMKTTIKRVIGFIVRNELYNVGGLTRGLGFLVNKGKLALGDIVKEANPPQKKVFVVLIPKGILSNIWEFNSVHGTMEQAKEAVAKIIADNPVFHKNCGNIRLRQNSIHLNYEYLVNGVLHSVATVNTYSVK